MRPPYLPKLLAALILFTPAAAHADAPKVVTSIKPVHSLVAGVMQGVGEPELLIEGYESPHTYSLRPSEAQALQAADVVFIIDESLEIFLEKPLETLAGDARVVALLEAPGVERLAFREGGAFETHSHDDDDHDGHGHEEEHAHKEEHAHNDDHNHDYDKHGHKDGHAHEDEHDHDDHAGHDEHGEFDPHAWLDPRNADAMVRAIADVLAELDPGQAARYRANAADILARLEALDAQLEAELQPVKGRPFVAFHDAYQYMERRYGLNAVGSITVSPEVTPGAQRVSEIRAKLQDVGAACVFSEPQFASNLVGVVTEGTRVNGGVLDPLGSAVPAGPDQYFTLMGDMADAFRTCLSPRS
ncbi:MAG: zinc ABC transporter substrate-binding protein [Alphaproteobacteria bacterium]|nr:zinc ABC transporter substrate-binding protein [Alphaproteobacteria bacterium]